MTQIKTKKQYQNALFLGKKLTHAHNWKRMYVKQGRKKKLVSDDTGGFLQCLICSECVFVNSNELKKYKALIRSGIPTAQIIIRKPKY